MLQHVMLTQSGGRFISEREVPWLRNAQFNADYKERNWISAVWIVVFSVLGGLALTEGVVPAAMFLIVFAVLMPIVFLLASEIRNRFLVPYRVRVLDDSALLLYSSARTKRIIWKEVQPPVEVRSLEDWHLNKIGENILFGTRDGRLSLYVDNRIAKGLRESYDAWCASQGQAEIVFLDKRLPLDRIIAGEGSRAIGYGSIIIGALIMFLMLGSAYILAGFSHAAFTVSVFVTAFSSLGFFAFFGLAEITSKPRYVKHALVALYAPMTPLVVILAIGTMYRSFLALLVCLVICAFVSYAFIWRKISKSEG